MSCINNFSLVNCPFLTVCNIEEFVAHAGNVNCLSFGKKNCRVFITGGDDQKVNLWSVGKPTSLTVSLQMALPHLTVFCALL